MQKRIILLAMAGLVLLIFSDTVLSERSIKRKNKGEARYALVIGNGSYKSGPLKNPVNDARDMSAALKRLGFTVIHKENAGMRDMDEAISAFWKDLRGGGVGLFYYAGHGMQVEGSNYLIPVDASIETESDVKYEAVDAGKVLGKMKDAGNDLNIVILDACRDNPFARGYRSSPSGLAAMDAPTGALIVFATDKNSVAADGDGRNGLFTGFLLKHMETPGLKIQDVIMKTRIDVVNATDGKQVPAEYSLLMGNFYFADSGGTTVIAPQPEKKESTMRVTSDVSRASVWINGTKYDGYAPIEFTIQQAGKYTVKVTADGYKDYEKTEYIEIGKDVTVQAYLEKEKPVISVKPSGGSDAGDVGKKPVTGPEKYPRPYMVNGKWYQPLERAEGFKQKGMASLYDDEFQGKITSIGEIYDVNSVSAAHKTLPLGTYVRVQNLENGKTLDVRINDRGPFVSGRVILLSKEAAKKLGIFGPGTIVEIVALGTAK